MCWVTGEGTHWTISVDVAVLHEQRASLVDGVLAMWGRKKERGQRG